MSSQLSERVIQDAFHSYLKSSLTQAKVERLIDADVLSSAEGDLMVTGPALCLYFAALRCTTSPPSVPLPRRHGKSASVASDPIDLSPANCPPAFRNFLTIWAAAVPRIQALTPESQHDLARVICGLPPLQSLEAVGGIAADLRAVAIEISQRRTFQDRYAGDLQAALDESGGGRKTSFVPPPSYDGPPPPQQEEPQHFGDTLSPTSTTFPTHSRTSSTSSTQSHPSQSPSRRTSVTSSSSYTPSPSPSPSLLPPQSPALTIIRETLYASLADALSRTPALHTLLATDPPRAYFASVSVAILDVALTNVSADNGDVQVMGVMGRESIREDDDDAAVNALTHGKALPEPTMERIRDLLVYGARGRRNSNDSARSPSPEGKTLSFANRISALSLGMTRLRAFRERQEEIFSILRGVGVEN
ncbi:hypothetical protein CPB85DRAFT_1340958 [Mucidula mucida]|nr:hypothetical protein CPB85DRAFT_1340958 [Mucidula mucida]